jgi:HEPN domain-containing protein
MKPEGEGQRWLDQARNDLAFARYARDGGYHHQACFVSQQAAEKALKALLYHRGVRRVIGHSVAQLAASDAELVPFFDGLWEGLKELDLFYIPTRYPNGLPGGAPYQAFTERQANRAIATAEDLLSRISAGMGHGGTEDEVP